MRSVKYMGEEAVIKKAMEVLIKELGPVEAIRFINMPKKKRMESVRRHREWQKLLDKDRFFDEVFGRKRTEKPARTDNCGHEMTEKTLLKRIVVNPKIMLGKPVIKGTRLPVEIIVEKVAYGATIGDLQKDYPFLKGDDVRAALLYAAKRIANEEIYEA